MKTCIPWPKICSELKLTRTLVEKSEKVIDELTKNHRLHKETSSGIMPEIKGSIYFPVLSFEMYLLKLHPECDRLCQWPNESFLESDAVWFCDIPVGEKKLRSFLGSLSKATHLSKVYTNHSILRATGASILAMCMYGHPQVMSVTGHKSIQSLSVYQWVSDVGKFNQQKSCSNIPAACQHYQVPRGMLLWLIHHLHQWFVKLK